MTITKDGVWLADERNNKASVEYFGNEASAREALESLTNCDWCTNCSDCSGCSRCSHCSGCSRCSRCSGCSHCSDCSGCSHCSRCSGCSHCSDCSGCSDCSDCSGCSGCSHVAYLHEKNGAKGDPTRTTPSGVPSIPRIESIHQAVYAAASHPRALEMGSWHVCETTHCRAGWVTHIAGPAGKALEEFHNTELAAMLIYRESSDIEVFPWRFYQSADDALADMKRCADEEAAKASA